MGFLERELNSKARRDLRDPQKLGEAMLGHMKFHSQSSMTCEWPAGHRLPRVPDYDHSETMQTVATKEYREDLERRMKDGDRYAAQRYQDLFGS